MSQNQNLNPKLKLSQNPWKSLLRSLLKKILKMWQTSQRRKKAFKRLRQMKVNQKIWRKRGIRVKPKRNL